MDRIRFGFRRVFPLFCLASLLTLAAVGCQKKPAEEASAISLKDKLQIGEGEATLVLEHVDGADIVLSELDELDGSKTLVVDLKGSPASLVLPKHYEAIDLKAEGIAYLNAYPAAELRTLSVSGAVEKAVMPPYVQSLTVNGAELSVFASESVGKITAVKPVSLAGIEKFPNLKDLTLSRAESDGAWDMTPLSDARLETLRISGSVSAKEFAGVRLKDCKTVQISDRYIDDILWVCESDSVTALMLTVSSAQPKEAAGVVDSLLPCDKKAAALVRSAIPAEQLVRFVERGALYLFSDPTR